MEKAVIQIHTLIAAPIQKVWENYNSPEAIKKWNQASAEWHCPSAEVDLREGGKFRNRMEAKDGSFGFDFEGEYIQIIPYQKIIYKMADDRIVNIDFLETGDRTKITIAFEAEKTNSLDMQKEGWQAILNSFKNYTEEKYE